MDRFKKNLLAKKDATRKLVDISYEIRIDEIEKETLDKVTTILIDGIGVLLHGINHHTVQIIAKYLHERQSKNGVKLIVHNSSLSTSHIKQLTYISTPTEALFSQ